MDKQSFQRRFGRFATARARLLNVVLGYRLGRLALVAGVAALLLLSGWLPNPFLNMGLFAALAIFLLVLVVALPVKLTRSRPWLSEAFEMEGLFGTLNSRLVSAWDFLERGLRSPLEKAVVERAEQDLELAYEAELNRSERNARCKQFLIWLVAFVGLGLTPWFGFSRVAENFKQQWLAVQDALFPVKYVLKPDAGTHVYKLGEQVELSLEFNRPGFTTVKLAIKKGEEEPDRVDFTVDAKHTVRRSIGSDVESEQTIWFEFGNRKSEEIKLVFTTPPTIVNMQTELIPPLYTRMPPRTLEGIQQRLLGLPGTQMTLGFTFSKELESATITWSTGEELPLDIVGRFAAINLVHREERQAKLQVKSTHGFEMEFPLVIDFEVLRDEKPRLFLPKHLVEDMPMLSEGVALFGFGVRAEDDYGITRYLLTWQRSTVDNPTNVVDKGEFERMVSPAQRKTVMNFERVFADMNLQPGDKLSFQVIVQDNSPEKQTTASRRCSLFIYQEDLGGLTIKQLGFGTEGGQKGRIAKSTRATMVKAPEGRKNTEKVRNEFEAEVASSTRPPAVRGEHMQATLGYFKLLSGVAYDKQQKKSGLAPTPQDLTQPPQSPAPNEPNP